MSQIATRVIVPSSTTKFFDGSVSSMNDVVMTFVQIAINQSLSITIDPTSTKPTSNQKIAHVDESGFLIDVNNMIVNKKYLITYDGSEYEIMKNPSGELEVFEVSFAQ